LPQCEVQTILSLFESQLQLDEVELKNSVKLDSTNSPLHNNTLPLQSSLNLGFWGDSIQSSELFKKSNISLMGGEDQELLFFIKSQVNLNKFFIEKLLFNFSGVDWLYYFFLPKTYQYILYKYSLFIKWVLTDSSYNSFNINQEQIGKLVATNSLEEISTLRVNRKL